MLRDLSFPPAEVWEGKIARPLETNGERRRKFRCKEGKINYEIYRGMAKKRNYHDLEAIRCAMR